MPNVFEPDLDGWGEDGYEYETLFYYDGPQMFARRDKETMEIRVFIALHYEFNYASGVIGTLEYKLLKENKLRLDLMWNGCKSYYLNPAWGEKPEEQIS